MCIQITHTHIHSKTCVCNSSILTSIISVWFGIRRNFYEWAVEKIPILQEYFNISYNYPDEALALEEGAKANNKDKHRGKKLKAPTGHIEQLDVPD